MKNLIRKISLIMCVIMLTFAVSACGKSDNDSKRMSRKLRTQQKMMQKTTQKTMQKIMTMLLLQESLKHWKIS
jgi:ABC-type Fe3+-citrate transport system substrate-binding protein